MISSRFCTDIKAMAITIEYKVNWSIILKPTEVTNKVTVKQIGPLHWTQHKEQMKQLSCDLIIFWRPTT